LTSINETRFFLVQIVASMNPVSSAGRHSISSRFTSIVRVASLEHPPKAQLEAVYATMLADVIRDVAPGHPTWGSDSMVRKLASSLLEVYDGVLKTFPAEQEKHYLFTPQR
jgi:dynein heavy chain 2